MSAIKEGDLVMVVGAHCHGFEEIAGGVVFQVAAVTPPRRFRCECCGGFYEGPCADSTTDWRIPITYLKRIDPPAELENEQREQETPVCA